MEKAWVALLRAINLGKRNKVPMAELRSLFEKLGCAGVRTYIQSGNVIFRHEAPDRSALEAAVAKEFGVQTALVLRTADEIAEVASARPFGRDVSSAHVLFLVDPPDARRLRALLREDFGAERLARVGSEVAVLYPDGVGRARLSAARLENLLGVPGTLRNWRTVTRLAELAAENPTHE